MNENDHLGFFFQTLAKNRPQSDPPLWQKVCFGFGVGVFVFVFGMQQPPTTTTTTENKLSSITDGHCDKKRTKKNSSRKITKHTSKQLSFILEPSFIEQETLFVAAPSESLICPFHRGLFVDPVIAPCGHTFCMPPPPNNHNHRQNANNRNEGRSCLTREEAKRQSVVCPLDGAKLDVGCVISNLAVSAQVEREVQVRCRYGCYRGDDGRLIADEVHGCPCVLSLAARTAHELICPHAPASCPHCDTPCLKRMNLDQHLATCARIPCPHKVRSFLSFKLYLSLSPNTHITTIKIYPGDWTFGFNLPLQTAGCSFEGRANDLETHLSVCGYESIKGFLSKHDEQIKGLKKKLKEQKRENLALKEDIARLNANFQELTTDLETKRGKWRSHFSIIFFQRPL